MQNLDPLAVWYLFIFGVFVPYLAIQSSRKVKAGAPVPPKKKIFLNTVLMELFFLAIALASFSGQLQQRNSSGITAIP